MESQKLENQLLLAISATESERVRSRELNVGYDQVNESWELIVKYTGNIMRLADEQIRIIELSNEYAIVRLPQSRIEEFQEAPEVEYIEKPKRLNFAISNARSASCINSLQQFGADGLFGRGVLIAVLDSGIDYRHPDFINEDGTTRLIGIWDQTIPGNPPPGYVIGSFYSEEQINEALRLPRQEGERLVPVIETASGHGTHVTGIAAGNGRASNGVYRGVASQADILFIKLGVPGENDFPKTTELMSGVDFAIRTARERGEPLVINLSFGNNYGSHSGTSLLETYLDDMANIWKNLIVAGTGNEGDSRYHTSGVLQEGFNRAIEINVGVGEGSFSLQLWKNYSDIINISIESPGGNRVGPIQKELGTQRFLLEGVQILLFYGEPTPYSRNQEVYIEFLPRTEGSNLTPGLWVVELSPERIIAGDFDMWLPASGLISTASGFLSPTPDTTLTIPSTAFKLLSVGAYDATTNSVASFSGRGYTRNGQIKPDLVAPGVGVISTAPGGGYSIKSGTSMATPVASGSAALLMEWGIVRENDPYLYGEKLKAYLLRGAQQLPGLDTPNPLTGWGALCVRDSLPG